MKFKKIVILILVVLMLGGCSSKSIVNNSIHNVRLAENYNGDWGLEAIKYTSDVSNNSIKIAVLDSGTNVEFPQIVDSYSTVDDSDGFSDEVNHGTIIISKLVQLLPSSQILSIKVFESNDSIDPMALKKGIEIAIDNNVDIINISLGYETYSKEVESVIKQAKEEGIMIVSAAGNQGTPSLLYPAAYDGVISVMSRDINNKDSRLNNYSLKKKSVSAPGEHILVDGYDFVTGSSIACVFVCATIASILHNSNYTNEEVMEILTQNAIYPTDYSYGLVQMIQ